MPPVQVRITLPHTEAVELMREYLSRSERVLAFEHEADEEVSRTHTHIYLFDLPLKRPDDDIRDHLRKYLNKSDFAAGLSAGKQKRQLTPEGAYIYATKKELKDPTLTQGFPDEEVKSFREAAVRFYTPQERKNVILHVVEQKPDHVWERFYEKLLRGDPEMKGWNQLMFKKWIMLDYLNRARPVPRAADLNRYAYSLYMLRNHIGSNPEQDSPLTMADLESYA